MGLYSHNGLLVMLLFHLCKAQDAVPPSPDPEPAPPSLGDVIDAVKAAFEQAIQISTDGTVHEALEQAAEESVAQKTPAEHPPTSETVADHTTEEAAVVQVSEEDTAVLTAGEPDAHVSESNEQTNEESVQGPQEAGLTKDRDEEPAGGTSQESSQEPSVSEPVKTTKESVIKAVESVIESVQEPVKSGVESALLVPQIVEVGETITEHLAKDTEKEKSPVQAFTHDTRKENETGRRAIEINGGGEEGERGAGELEEEPVKESEMEKTVEIENVEVTAGSEDVKLKGLQDDKNVKLLPGPVKSPEEQTESEISQEEIHAGAAKEDTDGVVVETEELLEEEQGAAEVGGAVIGVVVEKVKAETDLQKFLEEEEDPPTRKSVAVETHQEAEVNMDTKGPIKWQGPVITKSQATGGTAHEVNEVNKIITSRDPMENSYGEPALMNSVEELPSTPTLGLRLKEPAEEPNDSTHSKALGQEAWKIGAIAAAFFLILQTAVTIVYILKCRRKPNSAKTPKKHYASENGGTDYDATNTDTTIPIEEQIAIDDLPEYSQVLQEDVAMTTIPPDFTKKNSSHDLRTSVV